MNGDSEAYVRGPFLAGTGKYDGVIQVSVRPRLAGGGVRTSLRDFK